MKEAVAILAGLFRTVEPALTEAEGARRIQERNVRSIQRAKRYYEREGES